MILLGILMFSIIATLGIIAWRLGRLPIWLAILAAVPLIAILAIYAAVFVSCVKGDCL
jgi:hypothetical protein